MSESFLDRISPPKPVRTVTGPVVPPSDAYARKAMEDELADLSGMTKGSRNEALNNAALKLGRLPIDRDTLKNALIDACEANGHLGDDGLHMVEGTIESGFAAADREGPRMIPEKPQSLASVSSIDRGKKSPENPAEAGAIATPMSRFRNRILKPTDLRELPEPTPLIADVLDRGTTALLYAGWGVGKSFIALDWACSVASGRQWQGRYTERAKVLYVVAEGAHGFSKRVQAWETAWKTPITDGMMAFLPVPVNLITDDVEALSEDISAGGYEFVILDTLARCTVGAEENSAKDVGVVIDSMTRLVDATPGHRGVVLGVHHSGKNGDLRGSSAYEAGVDTVYKAEKDGQTISLRCRKRKDGPDNDRHTLRLASIIGTDSCVIEGVTGEVQDGGEAVQKLKRIFVEMFSDTGVGNAELRTVATEQGLTSSDLYRARAELISDGWLKNTGTASRPFWERNLGTF